MVDTSARYTYETKHRNLNSNPNQVEFLRCWMMAFQKIGAYPKWSISWRKTMKPPDGMRPGRQSLLEDKTDKFDDREKFMIGNNHL